MSKAKDDIGSTNADGSNSHSEAPPIAQNAKDESKYPWIEEAKRREAVFKEISVGIERLSLNPHCFKDIRIDVWIHVNPYVQFHIHDIDVEWSENGNWKIKMPYTNTPCWTENPCISFGEAAFKHYLFREIIKELESTDIRKCIDRHWNASEDDEDDDE